MSRNYLAPLGDGGPTCSTELPETRAVAETPLLHAAPAASSMKTAHRAIAAVPVAETWSVSMNSNNGPAAAWGLLGSLEL